MDEQEASSWTMHCSKCGKWDRNTTSLNRRTTLRWGLESGWTIDGARTFCPECS